LTQPTDNLMQNKPEETKPYEITAEPKERAESPVECPVSEELPAVPPVVYISEEEWSPRKSKKAKEKRIW
jgi:hypothetical protein